MLEEVLCCLQNQSISLKDTDPDGAEIYGTIHKFRLHLGFLLDLFGILEMEQILYQTSTCSTMNESTSSGWISSTYANSS